MAREQPVLAQPARRRDRRRGVPWFIHRREADSAVAGKRINVEWVKGPVGVLSRNLRQQADLLARLARPGTDQARDRADVFVDQGAGEEGAG